MVVSSEIRRIQIFGERCSGTNYLEALLSSNIQAVPIVWDYGFKHFFPKLDLDNSSDCLFVIIYRNPFEWLRSIYRSPWHAAPELRGIPFSHFIRKEWWCIWDEDAGLTRTNPAYGKEMMMERDPGTGNRFKNILSMRTEKIRAWEKIRGLAENTLYINYEQLRSKPKGIIDTIADNFSIKAENNFYDVKNYKGLKWYQGLRTRLFREPLPEVSTDDMEFILSQLDVKLESDIGYELETLARQKTRLFA